MGGSIIEHFSIIEDPRKGNHILHNLIDILVIAVTATICGANKWTEVEEFGKAREEWFATFLELPNGIPSHDTFGRMFSILSSEQLESCFVSWMQDVQKRTQGEIIAIDGKTVRGSQQGNQKAIHMVSAWATQNGVVLGQRKVNEKTNEMKVIPDLLDLLMLKGCIVTIDAMGCQKDIARKIVEQEADYVLALKGNQKSLHEEVELFFEDALKNGFGDYPFHYCKMVDKGHGRVETRKYWITSSIDFLHHRKEEWMKLNSIGMVESKRHMKDKVTVERRYYITSLSDDIHRFAECVRGHWGIENGLHWTLDVAFREDKQRIRVGHSAENAAVLRRIALNLLKKERTCKRGMETKRLKAGWDNNYLLKVLSSV